MKKIVLEASEADKRTKLLVAQKVSDVIKFTSCLKPCCISASSLLNNNQEDALHHVKVKEVYICGAALLIEKSPFHATCAVCESLSYTLSP